MFLAPCTAAGGEARSTDQATWEARAGWHQLRPAGRQGMAQITHYERDHCELAVPSLPLHEDTE